MCWQVDWKLTRGKWRPRLLDYAEQQAEGVVETASKLAFAALKEQGSDGVKVCGKARMQQGQHSCNVLAVLIRALYRRVTQSYQQHSILLRWEELPHAAAWSTLTRRVPPARSMQPLSTTACCIGGLTHGLSTVVS